MPEKQVEGAAEALQAFGKALAGRDPDAAAACFSRDACLLTADGTEVAGRDRIREVLAQLTAADAEFDFDSPRIVTLGEVTLIWQRWTMRHRCGPGADYERPALSTAVLRQSYGRWQFVINSLWS